ncbi:LysM peptidoglycan-binding domain-containing protein [Flavobacterium sp. UMI-01]|uniref:LysM peptidoglycan-binding domain-containing protein n=1 Tax=Flavobacterium sp. UMI-01 TaxID=1441053 RepID=UPI001C7DD2C0|nr:LysM peptidoglycan-binding domain-containing protein [Flavobacterium sp. UMI-01]GIZ08809.1 peptidoglycan endopeptidase [Flavobacterium sp. UMI-01]
MKVYGFLFVAVFLFGFTVFAQQKTTEHTVAKGETISKIAALYNVKSKDIYELNPEAKNGIKFNTKLLIPVGASKGTTSLVHEVLAKETLYGISKQYNVTVDELYQANPNLEETGLKVGQKINIITASVSNGSFSQEAPIHKTMDTIAEKVIAEGIVYEVLPKQTKYNIAKEHGITVTILEKANPILQTEELKIGQKIIIPVKKYIPVQTDIVAEEGMANKEAEKGGEMPNVTSETLAPKLETLPENSKFITHDVLPKETKYAIAKQHGITIADLDKANPNLVSEGLKVGQKIKIPVLDASEAVANEVISAKEEKETTKVELVTVEPKPIDATVTEQAIVTHTVLPKETKYGIAKEFGVTVKELERQNPAIVNQLRVGTVLTITKAKEASSIVVQKQESEMAEEASFSKSVHDERFVDQLISAASENIGTRYRIGGTTKEGFDCSGLMCTTYGAFDVQLPRTSLEQSQFGTIVELEKAQKGDLIFFKTRGRSQINHVGMVVEVADGDVKFIHASNSGVIISSIKESYYSKRVVQVNRVL